jgi:pyridoxamine 5'-phosphate oxidase
MTNDERISPIRLFLEWRSIAQQGGSLTQPNAVCLSTVDANGVPDGRFVDIKEVSDAGFTFCTDLRSPKAAALAVTPCAALTFWWDHVRRQVRVVGRAERVSAVEADRLFASRPRDAQIASWCSLQSAPLADRGRLCQRTEKLQHRFAGRDVPRPEGWGGYRIIPVRMEFLLFHTNRLHERVSYDWMDGAWRRFELQP